MQMSGENRTIVSRGLASISRSDFIGLHALLHEAGLSDKTVTSVQIGFVLAPRINAAGRMGAADMAADLLLCTDPHRAEHLARELCALNRERQCVEQTIYSQAEEMIEQLPEEERRALVLASDTWHQGVVGIVASRLSEKYSRPSFMIHLSGGTGKGSCRSWGGFNLFAALEACSDLLLGFGGHELAAGFTIDEANIPAFRERMNQYAAEYWVGKAPESVLEIDMELHQPGRVTLQEVEALSALEPYGSGNPKPTLCILGARLEKITPIGGGKHLHQVLLGLFPIQRDSHSPAAAAELEACGAKVADQPTIGSTCDLVLTMLPNAPQVKQVMLGANGVAAHMQPGSAFIDMTSLNPIASKEIAAELAARGIQMLDAPVSGGEPKAIDGTLSFMVGGEEEVFNTFKPVLLAMGSSAVRCGGIGAGNTTKLANQIIVAANIQAVAEALTLAQKAGVDPDLVFQAIKGGLAGSTVMNAKAPMMIEGNDKPGFKIDLHIKDLNNALDCAHTVGAPVPMTAEVQEILQWLHSNGKGQADHSAIAQYYEHLTGIKLGRDL